MAGLVICCPRLHLFLEPMETSTILTLFKTFVNCVDLEPVVPGTTNVRRLVTTNHLTNYSLVKEHWVVTLRLMVNSQSPSNPVELTHLVSRLFNSTLYVWQLVSTPDLDQNAIRWVPSIPDVMRVAEFVSDNYRLYHFQLNSVSWIRVRLTSQYVWALGTGSTAANSASIVGQWSEAYNDH